MHTFAHLLMKYMGRINASENWLGNKIGLKGDKRLIIGKMVVLGRIKITVNGY